ncbi:hypothetical protein D3C81_2334640 [compost metagenome]
MTRPICPCRLALRQTSTVSSSSTTSMSSCFPYRLARSALPWLMAFKGLRMLDTTGLGSMPLAVCQ